MSLKVLFSKTDPSWDDTRLTDSLAKLPAPIRQKITAYKNPIDRQSRIMGKLMLLKLQEDLGLDHSLDDLRYTTYNKPYFDLLHGSLTADHTLVSRTPLGVLGVSPSFDFSISHCDGIVLCAGALHAKVGIDTEPVREINVQDYRSELTVNEWHLIERSRDPSRTFLQIWTKKEALLKATGRGVDMDMSYIDVSNNVITVHKEQFSIFAVPHDEGFISHIAVSGQIGSINITEVLWE